MPEPHDPDRDPASRFFHALREATAQPLSIRILAATGIECFSIARALATAARACNAAAVGSCVIGAGLAARGGGFGVLAIAAETIIVAMTVGPVFEYLAAMLSKRAKTVQDAFGDDGTRAFRDPLYRAEPTAQGMARMVLVALSLAAWTGTMTACSASMARYTGEPISDPGVMALLGELGGWTAAFLLYVAASLFAACERPPRPPQTRTASAAA